MFLTNYIKPAYRNQPEDEEFTKFHISEFYEIMKKKKNVDPIDRAPQARDCPASP